MSLRKALFTRTLLVCLKFPRTPWTNQRGKNTKKRSMKTTKKGLGATRVKPEKYEAVNKAVMKWLLTMRSENIPLNGPMFKEKAQKFAGQLNLEDFHASDGWLEKLKKRYTYLLLSIYTFFFINNQKFKQLPRKSLIC